LEGAGAEGDRKKVKYRVYRFDIKMTRDQDRLEQFLNSLEGEVVTIIPNVTPSWRKWKDDASDTTAPRIFPALSHRQKK